MSLCKLFVNYFSVALISSSKCAIFTQNLNFNFLDFLNVFYGNFVIFFFCFYSHNSTLLIVLFFLQGGIFLPFRCVERGQILETKNALRIIFS